MGCAPKTVGFLLYDGCTLLDFVGATQVFAKWASHWNPVWIGRDNTPIETSEGLQVVPNETLDTHPDLDIVFVPGGTGDGVAAAMADVVYLDWLRCVAKKNDPWVGAVCVGTFIVAAAGLLSGTKVTTHWRLLDELRALAPALDMTVAPEYPPALVCRRTKRFTGGGVSSSIELALTLLRDIDGRDVATAAALLIQYAPAMPAGVRFGNPAKTCKNVLHQIENDPVLYRNLVHPIAEACGKIEAVFKNDVE